jgi:hypothetical protein
MAAPCHAIEHTACSEISIMPTREEQQDSKQAPKGRVRPSAHDGDRSRDREEARDAHEPREVRERSHADPMADEIPSICRGID